MYCLQIRKSTYQFCRRVPNDLRHRFACPAIRHSLQTKDYSEAKRRRNTLLVHYIKYAVRAQCGFDIICVEVSMLCTERN